MISEWRGRWGRLKLRAAAAVVRDYSAISRRWRRRRERIEAFVPFGSPDGVGILQNAALNALTLSICESLDAAALKEFALRAADVSVPLLKLEAMPGRGVLISVPHYGPFTLCALAFAMRFEDRPVVYLFQHPDANPDNARSDAILRKVCSDDQVAFDDRRGVIRAISALRRGGVCVLMPDITRSTENAFFVPFLGGAFQVQPGVATLARMANATVLPCYPRWTRNGSAAVECGRPILSNPELDPGQADFMCMVELFADFERYLRKRPIGWFYWPSAASRIMPWSRSGEDDAIEECLDNVQRLAAPML